MRLFAFNKLNIRLIVSIHASVKDATYADDVSHPDKDVSIHASVKDATGDFTGF